ncbi:sensor histidine kinase [Dawidia soli]|uniref:histidine kinase n=1 Tax=Dawidia soli TaxID=2782352 RepID=A0AAP2D9L7_9BACT|nr:HAMP domain-containing sensor histidine kinase [Dawidia soli]MBT1685137.1 HAMP domain-containing histidine kinase [Dawidia soli]
MFNNLSIRTKVILGQTILIAMVSLFIYSYYPRQQEKAAIKAIDSKIQSLINMFSIGVGIGMGEMDFVAVSEALEWAHNDSSIVYITVVNNTGQNIASFIAPGHESIDVSGIPLSRKPVEINGTLFYKTTIVYQNTTFGTLTLGYSLTQSQNTISRLKRTTLYFCTGLFMSGVIFSFLVSNMISGNIRELDATVKTISSGAENVRVTIHSNDEVGKLGRAFNDMLERLEHSRKNLVRYSEQLKKQNEELNQFSYVVSHDLKAPLRAIFKLSEWIEEDMHGSMSEESKKNMQILRGRVFRLEALINGLLQYSKIGRINVPTEPVDIRVMLKETIDLLNPPPHITITIQKGMPVLNTKKYPLQQVFINLLSNAIKYNDKEQGLINITCSKMPGFYRFTVEDNGMGIAPAYHQKVFEIFQTLQSRDTVEGTGVGLSIIKKSVEDMGGTVTLRSEENKGATFSFTWPQSV